MPISGCRTECATGIRGRVETIVDKIEDDTRLTRGRRAAILGGASLHDPVQQHRMSGDLPMMFRSLALAGAIFVAASVATPQPARADTSTTTLAYTFALTFAGAAAGAVAFTYGVPLVAPAVAATYSTVAAGLGGTATTLGTWIVTEPRLTGAITGMAAGLIGGLVYFDEGPAKPGTRR
jgi:hypothetical protein